MKTLTQRLIAHEHALGEASDAPGRVAFRVCEKLRLPLSTVTGNAGFHSLLSRALKLAKAESPWLAGVQLRVNGTIAFPPEHEVQLDGAEADRAGQALVSQLVDLLTAIIGEALALRLIKNAWPTAPLDDSKFKADKT